MKITTCYELTIRDPQGRVIKRVKRPSRSYVLAFIDLLYIQMTQVSANIVDTGNTSRAVIANTINFRTEAGNDVNTYGPKVGTGTGAVVIGDYALGTAIAHGTGAGTLDHQATEWMNLGTSGSTRSFQLRRLFVNASGAPITINECGLYSQGAGPYNFLTVRDLVSPGVAVPNGGSATLIYTLGVTV